MRHARALTSGAFLMSLMLIGACARDAAAPAPSIQAAKGAGGGGKGPVVSAADPNMAPRDLTLNVRVLGSGFDAGSSVSFAIAGTPSSKVHVNATSFVSSTELVANVTIAADADTAAYDIVVLTGKGIKGIGSEIFEIVGDPPATWMIPLADAGLAVTSDGRYGMNGYSVYESGVCGVSGRIFATDAGSHTGDAIIQTSAVNKRKCAGGGRTITFKYPDGAQESTLLFANLHELQNTIYAIPVGATVKRAMNVSSSTVASRCGALKYRHEDKFGTVVFGADSVLVTRVNSFTWDVQTQPYPNNRAYCTNNGALYNMPLRLLIEIPYPL